MLIINTTAGKLTFIRKPKSVNANRISSNFTTKPSYEVFISQSFNPSVFALTRMDGATQVCPDDPGGSGRRGGLADHMHDLAEDPWILTNESMSVSSQWEVNLSGWRGWWWPASSWAGCWLGRWSAWRIPRWWSDTSIDLPSSRKQLMSDSGRIRLPGNSWVIRAQPGGEGEYYNSCSANIFGHELNIYSLSFL